MLDVLGLDQVAEAVYRGMLAYPKAGVALLGHHLGLTEQQVRHALEALSELALVRPSADPDALPEAVNPQVGLELLLTRQQSELAAQQQRVEASRAAAAALISEYATLHPRAGHAGAEQIIGLSEVRDRLALLTEQVQEEVLSFAPGGPQTRENMRASQPLNQRLLDRGVGMRTVYLDSVANDPATVEYARWLAERGGEIRTVPALPTRMIIVDRATAVIAANGEDSSQGAVVLTGHGTLTALCALFESVWATGHPLGEPRTLDKDGLSSQYRVALCLLAEGFTDQAIANRLGISPRTSRRMASELLERLGARSRFQAGVHAVRNGWLGGGG
ncbi:helix-turn-helix transcriptional regulator [Kitasatospora sp. McL0602]|uniref:helix-turn-helix transcriptional regulator n=1 Tax=Kitasatospora sp. McL0602 TaxID=3439530 RepID=UPI003F89543C